MNNPEDREILSAGPFTLRLNDSGVSVEENAEVRRVFLWQDIVVVHRYPLSDPSPYNCDAPQWPRCENCEEYRSGDRCPNCALLVIRDPLEIYESFNYGLQFSDHYHREAFLKWVSEGIGVQRSGPTA